MATKRITKRSIDEDFKRILANIKDANRITPKGKVKPALTRYGYLIVDWPVVEDNFKQSGGGAVLLGEKDDLTIARSDGPNSQAASAENLQRLKADVHKILGPRFEIIEKHGNIFVTASRK